MEREEAGDTSNMVFLLPVVPHLDLFPPRDRHWRAGCARRRQTEPPRIHSALSQIDLALELAGIMKCAHVLDQRLNIAANSIHVSVFVADGARVLAVGRVALEREALAEAELARFEDLSRVALLDDSHGRALADHPEVFSCYVETHTAGWALT